MTDVMIQVDHRHRVHRIDNERWAVQRSTQDGAYDMIANWTGNRRSLLRWLDDHKVHPSRAAEEQIAALPERKGFKDDPK